MQSEVLKYAHEGFQSAVERFSKDMAALTHEDLDRKWGDSSRRAYDVVYELGVLNQRAVKVLNEEDPGPLPWKFGEEWLQAPDELRSMEEATLFFDESARNLLATAVSKAESADEEATFKIFKTLNFAASHTGYHDAQLNFIQALKGDHALHW